MYKYALILIVCLSMCGCSQETANESPSGFEVRYVDNEAVYIDYDLDFKVTLPTDSRFFYKFDYTEPALHEGAPIGRTLRIYYDDEVNDLHENLIEIICTPVGTQERVSFVATGTIEYGGAGKEYLINESNSNVKILSENLMELYCVKADLTKNAFENVKLDLERIIESISFFSE